MTQITANRIHLQTAQVWDSAKTGQTAVIAMFKQLEEAVLKELEDHVKVRPNKSRIRNIPTEARVPSLRTLAAPLEDPSFQHPCGSSQQFVTPVPRLSSGL